MSDRLILKEGDQIYTQWGRETAPYPKTTFKRISSNIKNIREWIKSEYLAEATHRNCEFNQRRAGRLNIKNWSKSDTDCALQYIFGANVAERYRLNFC